MAETGRKKSFLLFYDYEDFLEDLTDEEMGILLRAIFAYERRGKEPQFSSSEMRMAFKFIRRRLDEDRKNYLETCQKRAQAGAKGGKARAAKMQQEQKEELCGPFEETQANASSCWHMQANQADTETDTETETETETETDTGTGKETGIESETETGTETDTASETEGNRKMLRRAFESVENSVFMSQNRDHPQTVENAVEKIPHPFVENSSQEPVDGEGEVLIRYFCLRYYLHFQENHPYLPPEKLPLVCRMLAQYGATREWVNRFFQGDFPKKTLWDFATPEVLSALAAGRR